MKRMVSCCLIAALLVAVRPTDAYSKVMDGFYLESASTLNRGAWNLKSYLEFGSGAEPVNLSAASSPTGSAATVQVDSIRLPVEIRYGLAENWEVGGDLGFEADDGTTLGTTTLLDGSGLQRFRLLGKWNFWRDIATMADLAFLGDNELYYSLDGFDFGLKFIYGPQLGPGTLNLNLGLLFKGGDADIDGDGKSSTAEGYDNVFSYGIGYVYPYSDRFAGIFELAGGSSPYKGGSGVTTEDMMNFLLGARYGFTDQMYLDGGFGLGLGDGSPDFLLKVGMDWTWGAVEEYTEATPAPAQSQSRWAPSSEERKPAKPAETPAKSEPAKPSAQEPYYEQPTSYETPKPPEPPKPAGPTQEEQLQTRIADASSAFNRGDYVSASSNYEAAVKLKDNDPVLHYNLATCYFQLKKYADAKTYYKNAITLNPQDVDSRLYLGYTYYYLQDQASATREWQKVLEIDPSNTLARENLKSLGVE